MPFTNANGHNIHYIDTIDQQSERGHGRLPILMIHGLGSSQNYYMPVIPCIEKYRCIALDTYGAARSKSHGESLTLEQLSEDVVGVMDNLSISRAVLAGHSMGGPMALTIAAHHPDRVAGVVAIGPVNPEFIKPEIFHSRIDTVMSNGMEPLANTIPTAATNKKCTPLQKALIREMLIGQDPKSYASHCKAIISMKEPRGGFEAVKCPVMILAGDEDASAPMAGCQAIHEKLGSSKKELKVMNGVGHWHCVEAGEWVAEEVSHFVDSLSS